MEKVLRYIEVSVIVEVEGTMDEIVQLRNEIEEHLWENIDVNCGEPECCPQERLSGQPISAMGSSKIFDEFPDEED